MPNSKAICFYLNDCDLKFSYFISLGRWFKRRNYEVIYLLETPHVLNKFPSIQNEIFYCQRDFEQSTPLRFDSAAAMQWIYSDIDRHIWWGRSELDTKQWQRALNSIYVSLDHIRDRHNIQAVIFEGLTMYSAFCMEDWAKANVRLFLGLSISRIPGRFEIQSSNENFIDLVETIFNKLQEGVINVRADKEEKIDSYISDIDKIQPSYMKNNGLSLKNPLSFAFHSRTYSKLWASTKSTLKGYRSPQFGTPLMSDFTYLKRAIKNGFQARAARRYYEPIGENEDFFLYPLHYHPEASTSVSAKYTDNEFSTIKNIAISLPWGKKLYVKEHTSAEGIRPRRFYSALMKFPNIRLLSPSENTKQLIRDSLGIITLTSTVGYEALILNRPVIVLGDVFYSLNPNCFTVKDPGELPMTVQKVLQFEVDPKANRDFVKAYWLACREGNLFLDTDSSNHDLEGVGKQLEELILANRPGMAISRP